MRLESIHFKFQLISVIELASQGMRTRAIAPVVGASQMTVVRDVRQSETFESDTPRTVQSNDGITRTFQPNYDLNFS